MDASKLDKLRQAHADNLLTANELDQAAGGGRRETAHDSKFLNQLMAGMPGRPPIQDEYEVKDDQGAAVKAAWGQLGIRFEYRGYTTPNNYFLDGKKISRAEAMNYAQKRLGKYISDSGVR